MIAYRDRVSILARGRRYCWKCAVLDVSHKILIFEVEVKLSLVKYAVCQDYGANFNHPTGKNRKDLL